MNTTTRTLMLGLLCLGALDARAAGPTTNLVQNISLALTVYSDGDTFTNRGVVIQRLDVTRAGNVDIIKLIGNATSNTFSRGAKLVLVTPLPDGDASIFIKDGTNKTDVSGFFTESNIGATAGSSLLVLNTGVKRSTEFGILRFVLHDDGTNVLNAHFDAGGFTTVISSSVLSKTRAVIGESHTVIATLAGTGDFTDDQGTHDIVVKGTLMVTGGTVLVSP